MNRRPQTLATRAALLLLVAVVAGCAQSAGTTNSSTWIESYLYNVFDERYQQEHANLVAACARHNGLDGWSEAIGREGTPGDVDDTSDVEPTGSGMVDALTNPDAAREIGQAPETIRDPIEYQILTTGPVATADGPYERGCREWAAERMRATTSIVRRMKLGELYGEYVYERSANSPEMVVIEQMWSRCMAEAGFGGLAKSGDQLDLIFDQVERVQNGTLAQSAALQFDIEITGAALGCDDTLVDQRLQLRNTFADEFITQHELVLPNQ